jgi:3-methyladenine DNA glycosylase AlkD
MNTNKVEQVAKALTGLIKPGKKDVLSRFFKTDPGHYGHGDVFIGVMVPQQRQVAKQFKDLPLVEIAKLLASPIHEYRLTALLILVEQFVVADDPQKAKIVKFYLARTPRINNWDLVDLSAPKILGAWLLDKDRKILDKLVKSKNIWERRIAVVSTFAFIKAGETKDTWRLAKILLRDSHDLMHKATGWMLREAGKRDPESLKKFLSEHGAKMPRTMLRYSIEKFNAIERKKYLKI